MWQNPKAKEGPEEQGSGLTPKILSGAIPVCSCSCCTGSLLFSKFSVLPLPVCLESSLNVELQMFRTELWFWAPCRTNKPPSESLAVSKASQQPGYCRAPLEIQSFMPWLGLCVFTCLESSPLASLVCCKISPSQTQGGLWNCSWCLVFPEPQGSHLWNPCGHSGWSRELMTKMPLDCNGRELNFESQGE